jgi:hypothetical protein
MLFIQEFIRQRSKELSENKHYKIHFKHLVLKPNESIELKAGVDIYLLTDIVEDVRIESECGLFDWGSLLTNEQVYEHSGDILIENLSGNTNHLPFIQFTHKN